MTFLPPKAPSQRSAANNATDHDPVDHPGHYTDHPSGVECIEITEHMNFCLGNAIKYLWRAGLKDGSLDGEIEDLRKARWYIEREIQRLTRLPETEVGFEPNIPATHSLRSDTTQKIRVSGVPYPVDLSPQDNPEDYQ